MMILCQSFSLESNTSNRKQAMTEAVDPQLLGSNILIFLVILKMEVSNKKSCI